MSKKTTLSTGEYAYSKLLGFTKVAYPKYVIGRMHEMIAMHLEAVESGAIRRLLIFSPPRHGKTLLASEMFPAWFIGRNPEWQVIWSTYSQKRGDDVGRKVRNLVDSDMHRAIFPDCEISQDSKSVSHFSTIQGGEYFNVSVGGGVTGRGANLFIIDDPHKGRKEVESTTIRNDSKDWYKGVAYTRLMPDNRIVIINTRWHDDDLSGFVLKNFPHEDWVVLDLKAVAEEGDILGRELGEALWPASYPKKSLETIKSVVGSYEWNAQYQQRPVGREGGMVKHAWIKRYSALPELTKIVISWDTAFKDSEISDPSAATVWGMSENAYYLIDVLNKRMEFTELKNRFQQLYNIHKANAVLVEDRASGQSLIQEMKMQTNIPVIAMSTKNVNKVLRFDAVTPLFESGKVFLPENAHWLADYEYQITNFPSTEHDDMVDSTSQFLGWINKPRYVRRPASKLYWK
jgi:predicted phage terminase large subunit-like protein